MSIKISHELPISLLNRSYEWNDYEYCLPVFLDKYKEYKDFFLKAKLDGRFIVMDNSLFEGYAHTNKDLIEKINLIKPDIFITPDVWNDSLITYKNAKYWMNTLKAQLPSETKLMVVLQGKTVEDFITLYSQYIDLGFKHFAFNHSSEVYQRLFHHPNKLVNQMMGRIELVTSFKKQGYIQSNHYIHLLGCSSWMEGHFYKGMDWINSVDTSSPIINGFLNIDYSQESMFNKPMNKIEEFFEQEANNIGVITYNINKFKEIWS